MYYMTKLLEHSTLRVCQQHSIIMANSAYNYSRDPAPKVSSPLTRPAVAARFASLMSLRTIAEQRERIDPALSLLEQLDDESEEDISGYRETTAEEDEDDDAMSNSFNDLPRNMDTYRDGRNKRKRAMTNAAIEAHIPILREQYAMRSNKPARLSLRAPSPVTSTDGEPPSCNSEGTGTMGSKESNGSENVDLPIRRKRRRSDGDDEEDETSNKHRKLEHE